MIHTRVLVAVLTAMLSARPANAQEAASYRVRVDSIARELARKEGEQAKRDSIVRRQIPADTIRAGAFTIVTDPAIADVVRRSAVRATDDIRRLVGPYTSAIDTTLWAAIPNRDSTNAPLATLILSRVDHDGLLTMPSSQYLDETTLARVWEDRAGISLLAATGTDISVWLKGSMPLANTEEEWREARIDLVTAHALVARQCFAGDTKSCASALALVPSNAPLLDWYNREERRELIRRVPQVLRREKNALRYDACVHHDDDQACEEIAREPAAGMIEPPLGQASRRSLMLLALEMSGPRGYDRLVHANGSIENRLTVAAGVPIDSLLGVWQRRVTNAAGAEGPLTTSTAVASLCWVAVCALLALRSSRWR